MDLAYDHILEQQYQGDRAATPTPPKDGDPTDASTPKPAPRQSLQTEFQETFKAFSSTPWGAKLGGLWGSVQKQGQNYYEEAVKEAEDLRVDAVKGFSDLKQSIANRARSLSQGEEGAYKEANKQEDRDGVEGGTSKEDKQLQENETFISRFKAEAAKRLREVQKAEDAADEALLRFGTNIKNFLSEAITITEPEDTTGSTEVLFESRDQAGKRRIHTSRFDAQLHVIHTTPTGFTSDPTDSGEQWAKFKRDFDTEKKTDAIAADLEKYPELRQTMEALVPEKVEYKDFWTRYYFLRHVLEAQEEKRKELLKASTNDTEEVGWDDASDEEDDVPSTPQTAQPNKFVAQNTNDSSTTIHQTGGNGLKPEGRRSHDEKSVADSEASYDIVSGAPSRAASSPKEKRSDESDEDWE